MCPIGEYVPDPTENIQSVQELPETEIVRKKYNNKFQPCPQCGVKCSKHHVKTRVFHDLGNPETQRPRDIHLTFFQYFCRSCKIYFFPDFSTLVLPYSHYSKRVLDLAIRLVVEDGLPYGEASWNLWRDHRVWAPRGTVQNWVEASGKKRSYFR